MTDLLCSLDKRVFAYMCSFLAMRDKFSGLIRTSRSISQSFDVTECCRFDTLVIMMTETEVEPFDVTMQSCWQQLMLVDRMCHVLIHYQSSIPAAHEDRLIDAIEKLVRNESLQSLIIEENKIREPDSPDVSALLIGDEFIHKFRISSSSLATQNKHKKLAKFVWSASAVQLSKVEWSAFDVCEKLTAIELDLSVIDLCSGIKLLVSPLPNQLNHLRLLMASCSTDGMYMNKDVDFSFEGQLTSSDFLPLLGSLDLGTFKFSPDSLSGTVMNQTNQVRPLTYLRLTTPVLESSVRSFHRFESLIALDLTTDHPGSFGDLSVDCLTQLRVFVLQQENRHTQTLTNLEPLLTFLSHRPIQSLYLTYRHTVHVDKCIKLLASMNKLRSLTMNSPNFAGPAFKIDKSRSSLHDLIPRACWPELTYLSGTYRPYEVESLLRASPMLRVIDIGCWPDPSVFAMIGHFCPVIQSIKIDDHPPVAPEDGFDEDFWSSEYAQLEAAFAQYEQSDRSFSQLLHVNMHNWCRDGCTSRTFHYLLMKMRAAQNMTVFQLPMPDNGEGCSLLEYMAVRAFPAMHEVMAYNPFSSACELVRSTINRSNTKRKRYTVSDYRFVEPVLIPPICWADPEVHNVAHVTSDPDSLERNLDRLIKPLEAHMVLANTHIGERGYLRFRRSADDSGLDGRSEFMIALYEQFEQEDKQLLNELDERRYVVTVNDATE